MGGMPNLNSTYESNEGALPQTELGEAESPADQSGVESPSVGMQGENPVNLATSTQGAGQSAKSGSLPVSGSNH